MILALETGKPLSMQDVVAFIREGETTRAYLKDRTTYTVNLTPKTIAKRDALLAEILRKGTGCSMPDEEIGTLEKKGNTPEGGTKE